MVTLALVGYGRWGSKILEESRNLKNARVSYIFSPHIVDSKIRTSYICSPDYKDIHSIGKIDGAIVATPPKTHFLITSYLLKHKIPVLVEKPFVLSSMEAEKIYSLCISNKSLIRIGHIYLHNPAFLRVASIFKSDISLQLDIKLGDTSDRDYDETLWDWGPHALSMVNTLIGLNYSRSSIKKKKNLFRIHLEYPDSKVEINLGKFSKKTRQIIVKGKDGTIIFDELNESKIQAEAFAKKVNLKYSHTSPLLNELSSFVHAIKSQKDSRKELLLGIRITERLEGLAAKLVDKS